MTLKELVVIIKMNAAGLKAGLEQAKKELEGFKGFFDSLGNSLKKIGEGIIGLLKKAALGLAGVFTGAIIEGTRFSEAMIRAFQDATDGASIATGSFQRFLTSARDVAKGSIYSAVQVGQSLRMLAGFNLNVGESMEAVKAGMQLATATGMDFGSATNSVGRVLRMFKKDGMDAADIAGYFGTAMIKGSLDADAFSSVLRRIGPAALRAGWSFKDLISGVTALSDMGIEGMYATMSLRTAMSNLLDPTSSLSKLFKEWGIETHSSGGKLRSLSDILSQVNRVIGSSTELTEQMYNVGGDAFTALATDAHSAFNSIKGDMDSGKETVKKLAKEYANTLPGALQRFKAAGVEGLLTVFEAIEKPLTKMLNALSDWITKTSDAISKNKMLKEIIEGITSLLEPLGKWVEKLGESFVKWLKNIKPGDIKDAFDNAKTSLTSFGESLIGIRDSLKDIAGFIVKIQNAGTGIGKFFAPLGEAGKETLAGMRRAASKEEYGNTGTMSTPLGMKGGGVPQAPIAGSPMLPTIQKAIEKFDPETWARIKELEESLISSNAFGQDVLLNVFDSMITINVKNAAELREVLTRKILEMKNKMESVKGGPEID